MSAAEASKLLRPGLLEGRSILVAGPSGSVGVAGSFGEAVDAACTGLGARVSRCDPTAGEDLNEGAVDGAVEQALAQAGHVDVLVVDGAAFMSAGASDRSALARCMEASWSITRATVNGAFLVANGGGRIVYLAPVAGEGPHAAAARAGLENLARTLSIEWARHEITTVAIAPGEATAREEVATLAAYLASPAGAYFSGCLLDLAGPKRASER